MTQGLWFGVAGTSTNRDNYDLAASMNVFRPSSEIPELPPPKVKSYQIGMPGTRRLPQSAPNPAFPRLNDVIWVLSPSIFAPKGLVC